MYNNTYSTIKMKPVDVKSSTYINSSKEINDEHPKFMFQIGLKKFLWLKKLKTLCCGYM